MVIEINELGLIGGIEEIDVHRLRLERIDVVSQANISENAEIIRVDLTDYKEQLNTFKLLLEDQEMERIYKFIECANTKDRKTNSELKIIAKK
jgi:hypothetical protein